MNPPDPATRATSTTVVHRGLAGERTALAWNRSALSLAAVGAVALETGVEHAPHALGYAVGATLISLAGVAWAFTRRAYQRTRASLRAGAPVARPAVMAAATAVTTLAGVGAIALALISVLA